MAYASFKQFCIAAHLAREDDWDALMADWRRERAEDGLVDAFPVYLCRRNNISEIDYLKRVGEAFDWGSIDLSEVKPSVEARRKISSKVASQYSVLPGTMEEGVLVVAVSDHRHLSI